MNKMTLTELRHITVAVRLEYATKEIMVDFPGLDQPILKSEAIRLRVMQYVEKMVLANLREDLMNILVAQTTAPNESAGRCYACGNKTEWGNANAESHLPDCTYMRDLRKQRPLKAAIVDLIAESKT